MSRLGRLWRTVRHLKPIQVVGLAHFLWHRPLVDLRPAPQLRAASGAWMPPAAREPSLVGPRRLRFLSVEHDLNDCGWDQPVVDRLWRYNLHYFDDLDAQGAAAQQSSRSTDQRLLTIQRGALKRTMRQYKVV